jgi:LmbE family N-acetylglucosaminyl deacetylase
LNLIFRIDDAVLFASYVLLRERPTVITVCSDARVQERYGIDGVERRSEGRKAMLSLGIDHEDLFLRDDLLDPAHLERALLMRDDLLEPECVWVPLPEEGGHEDHEVVAAVALEVFGRARLSYYATYRRGRGRTRTDTEVIPEPDWPARKFAAMACYRSQITLENCRPWFAADDCLREWVVT